MIMYMNKMIDIFICVNQRWTKEGYELGRRKAEGCCCRTWSGFVTGVAKPVVPCTKRHMAQRPDTQIVDGMVGPVVDASWSQLCGQGADGGGRGLEAWFGEVAYTAWRMRR